MVLSVNHLTKIIDSTTSIPDIVVFKEELRTLEANQEGILFEEILEFVKLDLWGGIFQYWVDIINGYQLRFPTAGNYIVTGNINGNIVPVGGVFVDRTKSIAFVSGWSWWGDWITQQQIRDAMTLDTSETAVNGSIDKKLQAITNYTLASL